MVMIKELLIISVCLIVFIQSTPINNETPKHQNAGVFEEQSDLEPAESAYPGGGGHNNHGHNNHGHNNHGHNNHGHDNHGHNNHGHNNHGHGHNHH